MKTDKTYNKMRSELETGNHDLVRENEKLRGLVSYQEEQLGKYRKALENTDKIKMSFETLLTELIDRKIIKGWYYNGNYHWEYKE